MSGWSGPCEIELFDLPLRGLRYAPFPVEETLLISGAVAGITTLVWAVRRPWNRQARLHLWIAPATMLALMSLTFLDPPHRYHPLMVRGFHTGWMALLLTMTTVLLLRVRGRRASLAAWLAFPTLALGLAALTLIRRLPFDDHWLEPTMFPSATWYVYGDGLLLLIAVLFFGGVTMALGAFSPTARRGGYASFLATRGALMIAIAGLLECHRTILISWYLNDFAQGTLAWLIRERLLLGIAAIAVISLLARRRALQGPREAPRLRRAASALSLAQLALLTACVLSIELSVARVFELPPLAFSAPTCPQPPCTATDDWSELQHPHNPYPAFATDLGVVEVRFQELERRP